MWWKLSGLVILTVVFVFGVIPIKTHAALYDPLKDVPPPRPTFWNMLSNMYLTPGTVVLVLCILVIASFAGLKVIRGQW